jgi:methionyl-tRNA formyltransferase
MRIVFMGTPESAVPSLRRLVEDGHEIVSVWTQPDKPSGRGHKLHPSSVKEFALKNNLAIHQPGKIKTQETKDLFASQKADVAVVVAYGRILPTEFLQAPMHGCLNVHFSLLPKYRGAAPVNWAIVNGETETGVTTMRIVQELDAGPIYKQQSTPIKARETAPELMLRLAEMGAELLSQTIRQLEHLKPNPQIDTEATFAPILKREDGIINWSMDAFAIDRRVRGFQPWPNAYTTVDSKRLIIWRALPAQIDLSNDAGKVMEARIDKLVIGCGEGTGLRIEELQPEGSRRMTARDFINGKFVAEGVMLGS